ncbi:hypothetical protein NA57DRAFT_57127 [Rhizodiscina lignyota]|uniref:Uncharacterized protein n=1 Tax=Rhizodiscina lignyota TaxID=1504668 RepID=A0A9P4IAE6_9PEZI|nr:hypothetical protein NA57DRAFT_57127 [Rhizodiscina lignyota]
MAQVPSAEVSHYTRSRDPISKGKPECHSECNDLSCDDSLYCDTSAEEIVLQAEQDQLAYIDAQCARSLKDAYPELKQHANGLERDPQVEPFQIVPLLDEAFERGANERRSKDGGSSAGGNEELSQEVEESEKEPIQGMWQHTIIRGRSSAPDDGQGNAGTPTMDHAGNGCVLDASVGLPSSSHPAAAKMCPKCRGQQHECHCWCPEVQSEACHSGEESHRKSYPKVPDYLPEQVDLW